MQIKICEINGTVVSANKRGDWYKLFVGDNLVQTTMSFETLLSGIREQAASLAVIYALQIEDDLRV